MPCPTAMAWSAEPVRGGAARPKVRCCRRLPRRMTYGAPTSRASSGSAANATVTRDGDDEASRQVPACEALKSTK